MTYQVLSYRPTECSSSEKSENLRLCVLSGCVELRSGEHNGFCERHYREYCRAKYRADRAVYQAWFSAERERKIRELLEASTPSEQVAIERGRKAGRILRAELEAVV